MGRHKIPIQKIEDKHQRHICFSKRRVGLFKKAANLCAQGCSVAVVVISSVGNAFTFGHPSVESVAARFLGRESLPAVVPRPSQGKSDDEDAAAAVEVSSVKREDSGDDDDYDDDDYINDQEHDGSDEDIDMELDDAYVDSEEGKEETGGEEVERAGGEPAEGEEALKPTKQELQGCRYWWNQPIDDLGLEMLRSLERSIVEYREKVLDHANKLAVETPLSLCSWNQTPHAPQTPLSSCKDTTLSLCSWNQQ